MSNTLIQKLTNIKTAKDDLKAAFEGMGLNPGNDFSSYANFAQEQLQPTGSGVKLFPTIAAMNADANPHEGDLALVYGSSMQNWRQDTQSSKIYFPSSVTLPEVLSEDIWSEFGKVNHDGGWVDCMIEISSSRMHCMILTDSESVNIQYTSEDGQHYTRTDSYDETIDLGTEVYCEYEWNNVIGYFCQVGCYEFNGLYQSENIPIKLKGVKLSDLIIENNEIQIGNTIDVNYTLTEMEIKLYEMANYIRTTYGHDGYSRYPFLILIKNNIISFICDGSSSSSVMYAAPLFINNNFAKLVAASYGDQLKFYEFQFNLETDEFITMNEITDTESYNYDGHSTWSYRTTTVFNDYYYLAVMDSGSNDEFKIEYKIQYNTNSNLYGTSGDAISYVYGLKYLLMPNQFTLNDPNQILPGLIGYGKNGVVVGDNTIYNNLKTELISDSLCGNNNLNDLYYYENIPSNSREARYNLLKNKIIKFNKSTSQTDKKIGILKEHINLQGTSSYTRFIVDGLSIGLVFTRGDNNYEVVILDNNGQTHYLYDEMPENCGGILRAWYYNNHIYIIFSDKTNASIYKLYKCTNTDDIEMITEIIYPDTVAYFIDNSIFYINNGTSGQGSRKLYKFDLINELSSSVDLPFSVSSSHYLSRIGNVLTMCVYKLNDTFNKQTTLLQWNTNLELITNQEYTTNNTSNYMINQRNVMAFRLNNKLYFSQYGNIYEADEINHTYNYVGIGENKSSGMDFVWVSDNESLYTQELFTLFNYNEKNNITINDICRLNNFALLTYHDNNFVEIVELIDVDQINNISNNGDIVTIIFNEKNNISTINPIGKIINIIE